MQRSYEPTQGNAMIEGLKAIPCLSRRRHVNQGKENAGDKLEHEAGECGAPENIEPAGGVARNRVRGDFAKRCSKLQPQIEPVAQFLDQAHVTHPPALFATGDPGVGISPALMRSFPSSIL